MTTKHARRLPQTSSVACPMSSAPGSPQQSPPPPARCGWAIPPAPTSTPPRSLPAYTPQLVTLLAARGHLTTGGEVLPPSQPDRRNEPLEAGLAGHGPAAGHSSSSAPARFAD